MSRIGLSGKSARAPEETAKQAHTADIAANDRDSHGRRSGQNRSDRNIAKVRHHLEKVIDELQNDQHDYHGHREAALDLLRQAREQLLDAEQFDSKHPDNGATARPF